MRILIVHNNDINKFPPVKNLLDNLLHNKHDVTLISKDHNNTYDSRNSRFKFIKLPPYSNKNIIEKSREYFKQRRTLRKLVRLEMKRNDILWTTTDTTVRELGNMVLNYKHVMQLMELIEYVPLVPNQNLLKKDISKYARNAWKVVVPEYNRACIQKAWWNLDTLPVVLPNKPYYILDDNDKIPEELQPIVEEMRSEKRKKVIYQGVFYKDRNLDVFADAISKNSDEFCLYIMGGENEMSKKLIEKYPNIKYIPFVAPPNHLFITREADIGLLPYTPNKLFHYSALNALYCAPNKIYEYAAYGLPMIGTDVPGLMQPFANYKIGVCCKNLISQEVIKALDFISAHYGQMKKNCYLFFNDTDLDTIVNNEILEGSK